MKRLISRGVIGLLFSLFFLLSSSSVKADLSNACDYAVVPRVVRQAVERSSVSLVLPDIGSSRVCGSGVSVDCFELRYCNEASWFVGDYCHNNSNHPIENQDVSRSNGVDVIVGYMPGIALPRQIWLEYVGQDGRRNDNVCGYRPEPGGPRVDVSGGCSTGWVTIQNANDPTSTIITQLDQVRVVYNADDTYGFFGGGAYMLGYGVPEGDGFSSFTRLHAAFGRLFDSRGRLDTNNNRREFVIGPFAPGQYEFVIVDNNGGSETYCEERFTVCEAGDDPSTCAIDQFTDKGDIDENKESILLSQFNYCLQVPDGAQRDACQACVGDEGPDNSGKIYTAVGCIRTGNRGLTEDLLTLLMGISGGVALMSILAGAFLFSTSQGDTAKLKEAKALITAAVMGLFFIIFSIFILQFIGVNILGIPGLGQDGT